MFGPEICQNLDCPFQIPTCMNNRLAENYKKELFYEIKPVFSFQHQNISYNIIVFQNIIGAGFGIDLWQFVWQFHCYSGKFCLGCSSLVLPSSEQDLHRQQNIQGAATRALPDIMSGPEIFQNPDCPVRILVYTTIMTKNYKK